MRTAVIGLVLLLVGGIAVITGVLPPSAVAELTERVAPILGFVVAITVVTELAAEAGLFRWIAEALARFGRGRALVLWLLVVGLATLCTVFLSLDTTAVLLTPIVVVLARHVGLPPLPFALTTVWLANTASLLLPVSNLTNLLAQRQLSGLDPLGFAALMAAPALVAVVVPAAAILIISRRDLLQRYSTPAAEAPADRVLFGASAVVVALLVPALVSGVEVWIPSAIAAVVLGAFFVVRRPGVLRFGLIPWQLVVFAAGLFLVVESAHELGLADLLAGVVPAGDDPAALVALSGTSLVGANLLNNLPAYLAIEPIAGDPLRLAAVLIGVNAGPLITPWASLATLLWHERLTALDVKISWARYAALGVVVAPVTVLAAVGALILTRG
ncbi:MAG: SLC13 family permease [Naasia sp.]